MDWFLRFLACLMIIVSSIVISFLVCAISYLFSPISFLWMLAIILIDVIIIGLLVSSWNKEQAEKDEQAMAIF